eukprot:scaffold7923_cov107-Cylindrotheca_fusiformis.AAC.2
MGNGTICARDAEIVFFQGNNKDSKYRTCTCKITADGNSSSDGFESTGPPSGHPTTSSTISTMSPTSSQPVVRGCFAYDANGDLVLSKEGASFGSLVEGKCQASADWPNSGATFCAKDNNEITYLDENGFVPTSHNSIWIRLQVISLLKHQFFERRIQQMLAKGQKVERTNSPTSAPILPQPATAVHMQLQYLLYLLPKHSWQP